MYNKTGQKAFNFIMKKLIIICLCLLPLFSKAQQLIACRDSIDNGYNFWLYLPEDYQETRKPVVMFLHGKSLSGNDLSQVRNYGCIDALTRGLEIDAIVVAPQTNNGWEPAKVMEVYTWVKRHYPVDVDRFYVIGMSMGGYGTLDFTATYPDKVAAAMAMCGGATVPELCGLNETPLWIIHGTADNAVPVSCSQRVVDEMISCGDTSRLIFTKLKGANHTRLARIFYLDQTYKWLFSHSLNDSLRLANKGFTVSEEHMKNAYADLERSTKIEIVNGRAANHERKPYYIVKKGDTLTQIAVDNNTTVSILCQLNKMKKDTKLQVGRKIRVK